MPLNPRPDCPITEPAATGASPAARLDALPDGLRLGLADLSRLLLAARQPELDRIADAPGEAGRRASCMPGCAACCRDPVPLSVPEALMLRACVDAMPVPLRDAVLDRFAKAQAELERSDARDAPLSNARAYRAAWIDCPFLVDERCSIHALRPGACREHLVVSEPQRCLDIGDSAEPVHMDWRIGDFLAALSARLLGGAPIAIPLVVALRWCDGQDAGLAGRGWSVAELRAHAAALSGAAGRG